MRDVIFGCRCACGAFFIRPAPAFTDILPALDAYAAAGWGYGPPPQRFVRCPSCLASGAPAPEPAPPPPPFQRDLFR